MPIRRMMLVPAELFQFLIGRLDTIIVADVGAKEHMFQFLMVAELLYTMCIFSSCVFQFLIGRLDAVL